MLQRGRKRTENSAPETARGSKEMLSTAQKSSAKGRILTAGQGNNQGFQTSESHQSVSVCQPHPFHCRISRSKSRELLGAGCPGFTVLTDCSRLTPCL